MLGNIDIYQAMGRAGVLFALLLIVVLLMYIAFFKEHTSSGKLYKRRS